MAKIIYHAILVTGNVDPMLQLHETIKRKLWEVDANYVRLLSPLTHGMVNKIISFFLAPDGLETGDSLSTVIIGIRAEIKSLVQLTCCSYIEVAYCSPEDEIRPTSPT